MLAPCGLTLTRPGATAIRAGAMFRPCGDTLTPVGLTEIRVCTHTPWLVKPAFSTSHRIARRKQGEDPSLKSSQYLRAPANHAAAGEGAQCSIGSTKYEGRQGGHQIQWKTCWLTGWMLSAVGLMEMPVGEMPTRGAPTLMPVASMLMPAGEVFTKQGLYEKTEPPPDTCAARQTHHATCQARIADTLLHSELRTLLPLTITQDLLDSRQPDSPA